MCKKNERNWVFTNRFLVDDFSVNQHLKLVLFKTSKHRHTHAIRADFNRGSLKLNEDLWIGFFVCKFEERESTKLETRANRRKLQKPRARRSKVESRVMLFRFFKIINWVRKSECLEILVRLKKGLQWNLSKKHRRLKNSDQTVSNFWRQDLFCK